MGLHARCSLQCLICSIFVLAYGSPLLPDSVKAFSSSHSSSSTCNVSHFGAVGNGEVLNTASIQSAIDACASRKRSLVYFPPGSYLTGTLFLRSNMTLFIAAGATILGSPDQKDYPVESARWYVILAENAENVGITGGGEVNGQGLKFVTRFDERKNVMVSWNITNACLGDECRPRLMGFLNCKHVHVWNIHLEQPAYWCLHIVSSDFTYIHDISIHGDFDTPNNDGIDIDSSNNTSISRCHIDTGDDAICPKTSAGPVYNLTATDCWIRTKSCGVKLGSASSDDFVGLNFNNITIVDSHRGLGIQLRDSGSVYNTTFSNILITTRYYDVSWWGRAEPIYVTACPRNASTKVGSVHDVKFINIKATSENGIFLAGSDGGTLNNLQLINIDIKLQRFTSYAGGLHDYRPGCQELVPHRTAGIFMQHIPSLKLKNVNMTWVKNGLPDWDLPMDFSPRTVGSIALTNFESTLSAFVDPEFQNHQSCVPNSS